jgi:hypothetical protein
MSKFDLTKDSTTILTDRWFKLRLESKKDPTNVDFAYVTGLHVRQVKEDYSKSLKEYNVTVRPAEYRKIIKKVS